MSQREQQRALRARVVSLQCSLGRDCSFSREGSWKMETSVVLTPKWQGPGLFYTVSCASWTGVK